MKNNILIVINTMGLAGAEKALISMLKTFDYSRVSVSLLSIIDRGELFLKVPKEVHILNQNPSTGSVLGKDGTSYIARKTLRQMFRRCYLFRFIPYAVKNIMYQLKIKQFQIDKLLWLLLAETTPAVKESYDMAIAFLEGAATYYVADRVTAKKKIAFLHVNYEKAGYNRNLDQKYYEKMDYICCVSEAIRKAVVEDVFPSLSHITRIFPNIVMDNAIRIASTELGGFSDGFTGLRILTVARLHPQKGLDVAITAFAKLVNMGYGNIRWYVVGDGAEKPLLQTLIQKHELQDKFILLGSRENPYPYMRQCDIYIQPSRFEGSCLTLQEALILNKPCITTNFDGIPDLLHNGVDSIIIPFSEINIVNALKMLIDNEDLRKRVGEATRQLTFDFPSTIHKLYQIMDGIPWIET